MSRFAHFVLKLLHHKLALKSRLYQWVCGAAYLHIGPRTTLCQPLRVGGAGHIHLGGDVFLGPGSWLQAIPAKGDQNTCLIRIGDGVSVSGDFTLTASGQVTIEDRVLIGRFVHISDHSHAFQNTDKPIRDQGITAAKPVLIKKGAWLGQGVVVCPGAIIGRNSVIAANSVVKGEIPDYCIAAGAPAKVVRSLRPSESSH